MQEDCNVTPHRRRSMRQLPLPSFCLSHLRPPAWRSCSWRRRPRWRPRTSTRRRPAPSCSASRAGRTATRRAARRGGSAAQTEKSQSAHRRGTIKSKKKRISTIYFCYQENHWVSHMLVDRSWVDVDLELSTVWLILCGLQLDCWSLAEAAWQDDGTPLSKLTRVCSSSKYRTVKYVQKCRKICGLGCVTRVLARA